MVFNIVGKNYVTVNSICEQVNVIKARKESKVAIDTKIYSMAKWRMSKLYGTIKGQ